MVKVNDTKCKIIKVALKLFGNKGYDGTSVRDIAKDADVNLASVNYHFKNKQNLYFEVFNSNCTELEEELKKLYHEGMKLEDFSVSMFKYFLENSPNLLNIFRLILNDSLDFSDAESSFCPTQLGPPAGDLLLKIITEEVGEDVPLDARYWAVMTLVSHITHISIILSSSVILEKCVHLPHLSQDPQARNIRLHVRSLIEFIKNEPHSTWDADFKLDI